VFESGQFAGESSYEAFEEWKAQFQAGGSGRFRSTEAREAGWRQDRELD
jgi:hypothetical protein